MRLYLTPNSNEKILTVDIPMDKICELLNDQKIKIAISLAKSATIEGDYDEVIIGCKMINDILNDESLKMAIHYAISEVQLETETNDHKMHTRRVSKKKPSAKENVDDKD